MLHTGIVDDQLPFIANVFLVSTVSCAAMHVVDLSTLQLPSPFVPLQFVHMCRQMHLHWRAYSSFYCIPSPMLPSHVWCLLLCTGTWSNTPTFSEAFISVNLLQKHIMSMYPCLLHLESTNMIIRIPLSEWLLPSWSCLQIHPGTLSELITRIAASSFVGTQSSEYTVCRGSSRCSNHQSFWRTAPIQCHQRAAGFIHAAGSNRRYTNDYCHILHCMTNICLVQNLQF